MDQYDQVSGEAWTAQTSTAGVRANPMPSVLFKECLCEWPQ